MSRALVPAAPGSLGSPSHSFDDYEQDDFASRRYEHDESSNFKVVIRVRPPLPRELEAEKHFMNVIRARGAREINISENYGNGSDEDYGNPYASYTFTFDRVFDQEADQKFVYDNAARAAVLSTLEGYNASIIAYGQTGTGKTYTMEGDPTHRGRLDEARGIIPRAIEEIFRHIQGCTNPRMKFLVRASYLQIYNEVISDLLKPDRTNLVIREDRKKGVFVEGLSEWVVRTPGEIYGLMERGALMRATASTKMNEMSSRSHAVFIIIAEQSEMTLDQEEEAQAAANGSREPHFKQVFRVGKLNLVDLAGSERVRLTGATGRRLEESKKINQSLSALGNVIAALTDPKGRSHIPYRDSKLTRILEDSLGGNCKTTMMAMVSPAMEAFVESLSTLKFANRAKNIKNEARINEDLDQKALLRKYERELKRLRTELQTRSQSVVDKRRLLELEEQRRKAEQDKLAAITALETRSREYIREKEEKRRLEEKIKQLQGQMIGPGGPSAVEETPQFRSALMQEHVRIYSEYEMKVAELERERQSIEEDKAQVDRYKQLLLKQRDIMIALTARLNERDESILALQEELEAYDRHQRMIEEALDQKTAAFLQLQRLTAESGADGAAAAAALLASAGDGFLPRALSERRYAPYEDPVLFSSASGSAVPIGGPDGEGDGRPGGKLLTAEEKIGELTGLLEQRKAEMQAVQGELEEVQAEKVSLEYLLRERLEKMVQSEIEERLSVYRKEVDEWKAQHWAAEEARRTSEYMLELSKLRQDSPEFHTRLAAILQRETAAVQRPYTEAIARLKAEVAKLKEERQQAQAQGPAPGPSGAAAAEAAMKVRQLEARLESQKGAAAQFREEMTGRMEERTRQLRRLEEENQRLRVQLAQPPGERGGGGGGAGGDGEAAALRGQCAAFAKERSALKTILENKMKVLVDSILASLAPAGSAHGGAAGGVERAARDASLLQKLVNASIAAIRSSPADGPAAPAPGPGPANGAGGGPHGASQHSPGGEEAQEKRRQQVEALIRQRRAELHSHLASASPASGRR
eukprot:tig00001214_g7560.t1